MSNAEFDIGETLRKRLEEISVKKNSIGSKIENCKVQLKNLFSTHKPIRMTAAQLDSKINDLERRRTLTSLPLSEEKDILRQMDQLKKSKIQIAASKVHEKAIEEKKAEIETLRNELRNATAQIAELDAAIAKIDLAKRLGCATQDLQTSVIDCPKEKLGEVIGKGGMKIKELEKETGCIVDVDKVNGQVHLRGNAAVIEKCSIAIENITKSIEEEIVLTSEMHAYLFGNYMDQLKQLRKDHGDVYIDASKDSKIMKVRGKIDALAAVKNKLAAVNVVIEKVTVHKNEAGLVIGKNGETIKFLTDKFNVGIDVQDAEDETAIVTAVGIHVNVAGAIEAINHMVFQHKDMSSNVVVSNLIRNKFLQDSGKMAKELQKEVNESLGVNSVRLLFEKNGEESSSGSVSLLEIKAPRLHHLAACEFVKERLEGYESKALLMKIEPYMVSKFVGKGGKHIKEFKNIGTGAAVEIDGVTGEVSVLTDDEETKELVRAKIDAFVAENQMLKIPVAESMMGLVFGSSGKALRLQLAQINSNLQQVGPDLISLKGTIENITEGAALLRDFIASNYTVVVEFEPCDLHVLQRKGSILKEVEMVENVKTYIARSRGVVEVRGLRQKVESAVQMIKTFLFGDENFLVLKISVPNDIIGAMIGKGGSNITKFEKDYEGTKVNMSNLVNVMTIRGEEKVAYECRSAVIKAMTNVVVNGIVSINSDTHGQLSKATTLRKITNGLPVTVTLTNSHAKLRGHHLDVPVVKAAIVELESKKYEGNIPLVPQIFDKVIGNSETTEVLNNISNETKSEINMDKKNHCIQVSGKRADVKKAKLLFLDHLEHFLPHYCSKVKVASYFVKMAREAKALMKMTAESTCNLFFDHDLHIIFVQATSRLQLLNGLEAVQKRLDQCKERVLVMAISSSDSWIFSLLQSQYRQDIAAIEKSCKCKIDTFRTDSVISIVGDHDSGEDAMIDLIARIKKENIFMDLPESSMPRFVGQSMKNMNNFAASYSVQIDRVKKVLSRIHIYGEASAVSNAFIAVNEWIARWETKNPGTVIYVDNKSLPIFLNTKPSSEKNRIARDFGVKLDVYCDTSSITIRGGKDDSHQKALKAIQNLCESVGEKKAKESEEAPVSSHQEPIKENPSCEKPPASRTVNTGQTEMLEKPNAVIEENVVPVMVVEKKDPVTKENLSTATKMFNFLVSDASLPNEIPQDPWDASTISGSVDNVEEGYFRSASGFTIRM